MTGEKIEKIKILANNGTIEWIKYKRIVDNNNMGMEFLQERKDLRNQTDIVNDWRLVMTDKEIDQCVKKCADVINKKFQGKEIVLTCILKGAVYFFVDLSRYINIPYSCYFIEATSYHNGQTQSDTLKIMGSIEPSKFINKHVILLDELFDNGHTMHQIKNAINEKANIPLDMIFTCTLFKKNKYTTSTPPDLYGVNVPDIWLVGYGLDDRQEKRGWTYLFGCPKSVNIKESEDDIIFKNEVKYKEMRSRLLESIDH